MEPDTASDEALTQSITRYGILHPPIVREKSAELYTIVTGWKRLQSLRACHAGNTVPCLVVSGQTPGTDVFLLILEEIQFTRPLTIVEKAILLKKITHFADTERIVSDFLPLLGLPPHAGSPKQALQLLTLEKPILQSLHEGQLNKIVAHDFLHLSSRDRMALLQIITSLRLSFSYQKKLLVICRELAKRSNTSIEAWLNSDEVRNILSHPDANPPQKAKNLMLWLTDKHMPRYTQATAEFRRFITQLHLPKNVSVAHTPCFEDDEMTLSITFSDRKSLQHAWDRIRHTTHSNEN